MRNAEITMKQVCGSDEKSPIRTTVSVIQIPVSLLLLVLELLTHPTRLRCLFLLCYLPFSSVPVPHRLTVRPLVCLLSAANLFRLLSHYRPESREEKKQRLKAAAESAVKGDEKKSEGAKSTSKPFFLKYGLNHITDLIENKKAKLVVIGHDVDPIELVVWLPALCRKMNVPYAIVKGKARLGHIVHKKSVSAVALTEVRKEDQPKLEQFISNVRIQFNDNVTDRKKWGGGIMGVKATHVIRAREKAHAKELVGK